MRSRGSAALVLTGAPGAGKSTVLEMLGGRLGDEGMARELAAVIPGLPGVDVVVSNEDRPAEDVTAQVRDAIRAHGLLGG